MQPLGERPDGRRCVCGIIVMVVICLLLHGPRIEEESAVIIAGPKTVAEEEDDADKERPDTPCAKETGAGTTPPVSHLRPDGAATCAVVVVCDVVVY